METVIRKISIGIDYKNEAMHYSVGQQVWGGHEIACILKQIDKSCVVYIKNGDEIKPWKEFYPTMAIALEFDLEY